MKMEGKKIIMFAGALICAGMLIFCGALAASEFSWQKLSRDVSGYEERTFNAVGSFSRVQIDGVDANISIQTTAGEQCTVIYDDSDRGTYHVGMDEDTLVIERDVPWFDTFGIIMSAPKVTVYLPEAEYEDLDVSAVSGSIRIDNLDAKRMNLTATSGKIALSGVNVARDASLKTVSGGIHMEALRADSLTARTTSGGIRLDGVDARDLELRTVSGSIRGTLLSGKEFEASSVSGRIDVPESNPGAGVCSASTTSGRIEIGLAE